MALSNVQTLFVLDLNSGTALDQITDLSINWGAGAQKITQITDGEIDPQWVNLFDVNPTATFSTNDISGALSAIGINGLSCTNPTTLFARNLQIGGTRLSTGTKFVVAKCMIVPRTLTVNHTPDPAVIEYEMFMYSADGSTSPLAVTANQSLSGTSSLSALHTLGAVTVDGDAIKGIQSVTVDFGLGVEGPLGSDGDSYGTFVTAITREPTVTITGKDLNYIATLGLPSTTFASSTTVVLNGLAQGGLRGGSPVTLTFNEGMGIWEDCTMSQGSTADWSFMLHPSYDGSNAIVVVS